MQANESNVNLAVLTVFNLDAIIGRASLGVQAVNAPRIIHPFLGTAWARGDGRKGLQLERDWLFKMLEHIFLQRYGWRQPEPHQEPGKSWFSGPSDMDTIGTLSGTESVNLKRTECRRQKYPLQSY